MCAVTYRKVEVDGIGVFYREAGPKNAPTILLLHGFPTAGHMFRDLIPRLADRFRLVAPDLPGFGQSDMPARSTFSYTFDHLAKVIERFVEAIGLDRFAIYVFDYGAPVIRAYWQEASPSNREALRTFLAPETTRWQYTHGVPDATGVSPDGYSLDNFYLARPAPTRSSWIYSATTRATLHFIRRSKTTSALTSRGCSRRGERTIPFSCPRAPRPFSGIFPARRSSSSIRVILRSRRMRRRLGGRLSISSDGEVDGGLPTILVDSQSQRTTWVFPVLPK